MVTSDGCQRAGINNGITVDRRSFRLIVTGQIGVKEIERLIKKLELDKEILADHDPNSVEDLLK